MAVIPQPMTEGHPDMRGNQFPHESKPLEDYVSDVENGEEPLIV
jgi:hypothetical protein